MEGFFSSPFADIRVMAQQSAARGDGWRRARKPSTGKYSTGEALLYRAHKGAQNSLISNLIDSAKIMLSPNEKLARFANSLQRQRSLEEYHPNVAESLRQNPYQNVGGLAGTLAEFGGMIAADPLSYIGATTLGTVARATAVSAGKVGAGILGGGSALSVASSQYVLDGKVRYKEVALWGAVMGGLGGYVGSKINTIPKPPSAYYADTPQGGLPQTAPGMPEAPKSLLTSTHDTMDPDQVASIVRNLAQQPTSNKGRLGDISDGYQMATGSRAPKEVLASVSAEVEGRLQGLDFRFHAKPHETDLNLNMLEPVKETAFSNRIAMQSRFTTKNAFDELPRPAQIHLADTLGEGKKDLYTFETALKEVQKVYSKKAADTNKLENLVITRTSGSKTLEAHIRQATKVVKDMKDPLWMAPKAHKLPLDTQIDTVYQELKAATNNGSVSIDDIKLKLPHLDEVDISRGISKLEEEGIAYVAAKADGSGSDLFMLSSVEEHAQKQSQTAFQRAMSGQAGAIFNQAGFGNQQILKAIAGASVGMIVGHNYDEENGAVIGAIMGGLAPWALGKKIGHYRDFVPEPSVEAIGGHATKYVNDLGVWVRPLKQIRNMGDNGKEFAAKLEIAEDNTQLALADGLVNYNQAKGKVKGIFGDKTRALTDEEGAQVADLVEGKISPANLPEHIKKAAKASEKIFKKVAKDAYESGVWDRAMYEAALKKKYFPHIYDEQLLNSKAGVERFTEAMRSIGWTEKSLTDTLAALTGSRTKAVNFVKNTRKNGETYVFDVNTINAILKTRKANTGGSSTHLDHQRNINVGKMDEVMDQFRIRNPDLIMDRYLNDTYRRIEHARVFGAKNEAALENMYKIEQDMIPTGQSPQAMELVRETFYKQLGDQNQSKILKAYAMMPEWVKTLHGKAAAFEVFKLAYSQILQPTSAFVNGAILTTKYAGFATAFKNSMSTFMKSFSKDPIYKDFAQRAAAGINVGLLDHISSATTEATLFGRSEFATNKLKWINSPQGFLKTIGFFEMEKFTQTWATHQGHALAENLIARNDEILRGAITDQKVIKKVRDGMDELGLDWHKAKDEFNVKDMYTAGLRFNRTVNFVDGARQLPHTWNNPYASMFRMYKTYAYRQGAFMNDHVLGEMKKKNFQPAAMFIAAGAPAGWTVSNIRDMLMADDREYSNMSNLLRSLNMAGGLGFAVDIMHAGVASDYDLFKQVIGPAPGDILRVSQAIPDLVGGNWKPLANAAVRSLPEVPGGFKRTLAEDAGIMRKRNPQQRVMTFGEEIRSMWNAVDKEKKSQNNKPGISLGGNKGGISLG